MSASSRLLHRTSSITELTLQDRLDIELMREIFSESFICVNQDVTVHKAAEPLNKAEGYQDIFVTEKGDEAEGVLG